MKKLNKKRKGFSLVELVVVMAIIGILLVVMAPNYKGFIDDAKRVEVKADARTLQTMITLVEANTDILDTATVESLTTTLTGTGTEVNNLKDFIAQLTAKNEDFKTVTVSQLPDIVKNGVLPTSP